MAGARDIQRRIKSVKNTKKITKAMEMVSSSKMRRAVGNVLATRPYSDFAWEMIVDIASKTNVELHPLLFKRESINKIGVIVITSNRGLCGSFNQQVINKGLDYIKSQEDSNVEIEVIALGKKAARGMVRFKQNVVAEFEKDDVLSEIIEIRPLAKMILNDYLEEKYDKVVVVYTDFISALKQISRVKQLLPIEPHEDEALGKVGKAGKIEKSDVVSYRHKTEYIFEPNPKVILDDLLPRLLEVQIYQASLESNASEHSARMMAMKNASEAANDMIDELTLTYNQARQAAITAEIAEISGGKAALE